MSSINGHLYLWGSSEEEDGPKYKLYYYVPAMSQTANLGNLDGSSQNKLALLGLIHVKTQTKLVLGESVIDFLYSSNVDKIIGCHFYHLYL